MKKVTILTISGGVLQGIDTTDNDHTFVLIDWDNIKSGEKPEIYPETIITMEEANKIIVDAGGEAIEISKSE